MALDAIHPHGSVPEGLEEPLLQTLAVVRPDADLERVRRAYRMGAEGHKGQFRKSGEPYITHPLEVARIVAELRMDEDSIIAAILHDVVEDTPVTREEVEKEFGPDVRAMVEGVTKLGLRVNKDASEASKRAAEATRTAETLRKMLLAMAKDIRVMVIKLADRLHNMRTIAGHERHKQIRIAQETLDIYAPLAARLGIWQVKWQLEDLAFQNLHPEEYARISGMVAKTREDRDHELSQALAILRTKLDEKGLGHAIINGRSKHLFSIYNKVFKHNTPFEEIYDLTALRILVDQTSECYLALGIIHEIWLPMPGLFYDYIGSPKPNGYQSIHTKVLGPGGQPLEVQIRTHHMHEVAEYGVAAHWSYKEGKVQNDGPAEMGSLRKQLFDWSSDARTSSDFLRTVSSDLFSEQVFVFTPKGDVLDLPVGATPLDFAFRIHTNLGLKAIGAKVNGNMVSLGHTLQNGDVVEMVTRSNAHPSLDWLRLVKSQHAKSKIRAYLRKASREENQARGRDVIEKELKRQGLDPKICLSEENLALLATKLRHKVRPEDIFVRVGEGLTGVQSLVEKLKDLLPSSNTKNDGLPEIRTIRKPPQVPEVKGGLDGVMYRRGKCCGPIPGDEVSGYISRGRGIVIHRVVCPNLLNLMEQEPERVSPMSWVSDGQASFSVALRITCFDRNNLLHDITTVLAESKAPVLGARIKTIPKDHTAEINFTVSLRDMTHLREIQNRIRQLQDVISILRTFGKGA